MPVIELLNVDRQQMLIDTSDILTATEDRGLTCLHLKVLHNNIPFIVRVMESLSEIQQKVQEAALSETIRLINEGAQTTGHPDQMPGPMGLPFATSGKEYWVTEWSEERRQWVECSEGDWTRMVRAYAARKLLAEGRR